MANQELDKSNPFSTGGGGVSFERSVAAYYMVQLLAKEMPRGLPSGVATHVRFQTREKGTRLDDLLVIADNGLVQSHLQIQAKHGLHFTEKDATFKTVIADAWSAFNGRYGFIFDPESDRLGIVVEGLPANARRGLLGLLQQARDNTSGSEFWQKANGTKTWKKFADLLRGHVNEAQGDAVSDESLWSFLRCLVVLEFDMEHEGSYHLTDAWNKLLDQIPERNPALARSVFDTLIAEAHRVAPTGGTVDREILRLAIRLRHPELWPEFSPDDQLAEELQQISRVFVPPAEYEQAKSILLKHNLVVLAGPPHSGKSATGLHLALSLSMQDDRRRIVRVNFGEDFDTRRVQPNSVLILDDYYGAVKLNELSRAGRFSDLEWLARRNHIIVTTRASVLDEAKRQTRLSEQATFDQHVVRLSQEGSYSDAALTTVLTFGAI